MMVKSENRSKKNSGIIADPYRLKIEPLSTFIDSAVNSLSTGSKDEQCLSGFFRDEFFVVSQGINTLPHASEAAKLAVSTAVWGYRLIRQKTFYWADKRMLLYRLFRTTNITLWQKRRETGYTDGLAVVMSVVVTVSHSAWIGVLGDIKAIVFKEGNLIRETADNVDYRGVVTSMIGLKRYGIMPQRMNVPFKTGGTIILLTSGISKFINRDEIAVLVKKSFRENLTAATIAQLIVEKCRLLGASENGLVYVLQRKALKV